MAQLARVLTQGQLNRIIQIPNCSDRCPYLDGDEHASWCRAWTRQGKHAKSN